MIHEGDEEEDTAPVSFSWITYISTAKLGLTLKESGRLTYGQFKDLYRAYQNTFDVEMILFHTRTTYEALRNKAEESDEWLK